MMKKTKVPAKKLALSPETIRDLHDRQLAHAAGGAGFSDVFCSLRCGSTVHD
jgi:hypothetical protein